MTQTFRSRRLVVAVAAMAATCAMVLAEIQTSGVKQIQPIRPATDKLMPVITGITPTGLDGIPFIQGGRPFAVLGRNFPSDPEAVTVVISSKSFSRLSGTPTPSKEVAMLRPSQASATRLDVLAPASLPTGTGAYVVQVVNKGGARSNAVAVRYAVEAQLTIAGYLRDANNNGFPGIRITASDPAKPVPYEAWTDSTGHYALRVPAPFTGQVLVQRPNNCFNCSVITRNLVNQVSDLFDVNFVCTNTTLIVGRTRTQYNEIIKGVLLDGLPGGPVTNDYGDYQVKVPCGWSGTVTPVKTGWAFSPPSFSYSNLTQMPPRQDYIGTALRYRISGVVRTSDGTPIAGVKLSGLYPTSSGESNTTDTNGGYAVSVYHGWSGTATPLKEGYSFSPASRSYASVVAAQQNQDYVGTPATTMPLASRRPLDQGKSRAKRRN